MNSFLQVLSQFMETYKGIQMSFEIWPFHKDAFKSIDRKHAAWPHGEEKVFGSLVGWFEWSGRANDEFWLSRIKVALSRLKAVASDCPENRHLPINVNWAPEDTPLKSIYRDNLKELQSLRNKYDPDNVMGLAKGFVIDAGKAKESRK